MLYNARVAYRGAEELENKPRGGGGAETTWKDMP